MKNDIISYLDAEIVSANLGMVAISFAVAFALGVMLFIAYKFCYSGSAYNGRFNVSLLSLTLITTLVMSVIGGNVALSLGMVGALSIVRFRTAIKDPRDTVYIFWAISIGICCGVHSFVLAFIGSAAIFLTMLIFAVVKTNDRFLIIIEMPLEYSEKFEKEIQLYFRSKAKFSIQNVTKNNVEYIYEVNESIIRKSNEINGGSFASHLKDKIKINRYSLVMQMDEMSR